MLGYVDNLTLKLAKPVKASDDTLTIAALDLPKLNAIGLTNHIYLTLKQGATTEIVRYEHIVPLVATLGAQPITVVRDVNGAGRKNFALPLCATAELNILQLQELICQLGATCFAPIPPPPQP